MHVNVKGSHVDNTYYADQIISIAIERVSELWCSELLLKLQLIEFDAMYVHTWQRCTPLLTSMVSSYEEGQLVQLAGAETTCDACGNDISKCFGIQICNIPP